MQDDKKLYSLSRRKVLAGLGTVGLASAGAGLGTTAYFGDSEALRGFMRAGKVDLKLDYRTTYMPWLDLSDPAERERVLGSAMGPVAPVAGTDEMVWHIDSAPAPGTPGFELDGGVAPSHQAWGDAIKAAEFCDEEDPNYVGDALVDQVAGGEEFEPELFVELVDIKPYDEGETTFSLHLCGNPAYLYVSVSEYLQAENVVIEPEEEAGETDDPAFEGGELADYMYIRVYADRDCDNQFDQLDDTDDEGDTTDDGDDVVLYEGSLAYFLEYVGRQGEIPLTDVGFDPETTEVPERVCFDPDTSHCFVMEWYLPCKAGTEVVGGMEMPGFDALGSNAVLSTGDIAGTMADELTDKGLPTNVNVTQTDSVEFGFAFRAEQCRHQEAGTETEPEVVATETGTSTPT